MDKLSHWCHGVLFNLLTTRSAKVRAKYDRLGTISRAYLIDNLSHWCHGEHLALLTTTSAKVQAKYGRRGTIFKGKLDGQP